MDQYKFVCLFCFFVPGKIFIFKAVSKWMDGKNIFPLSIVFLSVSHMLFVYKLILIPYLLAILSCVKETRLPDIVIVYSRHSNDHYGGGGSVKLMTSANRAGLDIF